MTSLKYFTLALIVLQAILILASATGGKVKECGACGKDSDCAVDRCLKRKCVFNNDKSVIKCFPRVVSTPAPTKIPKSKRLGECAKCSRNADCVSNICSKNKCLFATAQSIYKCFPNNRKSECSSCGFNIECGSGLRCDSRKCIRGPKKTGLARCSKLHECATCRSGSQCILGKCIGNKCTSGSAQSLKKCKITIKKRALCSRCSRHYECKSNRCVDGVCKRYFKSNECKKNECARCSENTECKAGKCTLGLCSNGSITSRLRCGKLKACRKCSRGGDCASNFCFKNICYNDKRSIGKCK